MKIGTRISPDWLQRPDDLKFLKQIGVDVVDITMDICPGYVEAGGRANRAGLQQVAETMNCTGQFYRYRMRLASRYEGLLNLMTPIEDLGTVAKTIAIPSLLD